MTDYTPGDEGGHGHSGEGDGCNLAAREGSVQTAAAEESPPCSMAVRVVGLLDLLLE